MDAEHFVEYYTRSVCFLLLALILAIAHNVCAQETAPTIKTPENLPPAKSEPFRPLSQLSIEEAAIELWVKNHLGKPILICVGYSIDEIESLLKYQRQQPGPSFTIQEIDVVGKAENAIAKLNIRIDLTTRNEELVRVPLGFKGGVFLFSEDINEEDTLEKEIVYEGPFSHKLSFDKDLGCYFIELRKNKPNPKPIASPGGDFLENNPEENGNGTPANNSEPDEISHKLKLNLCFPLSKNGLDENRLLASFPQSLLSRLRLVVPTTGLVISEAKGVAQSGIVENKDLADPNSETLFEVQGLGPGFELAWQKEAKNHVEESPILQVEGATIFARLNRLETEFNADLPVRVHAGTIARFHVRIPEGARWVPIETDKSEYTVRAISSGEETGAEIAPILEITPRSPLGPNSTLTVRLRAMQAAASDNPLGWRDIQGFEVIEADRQYGTIEIAVPPEMRLYVKPVRHVQQIDITEAEIFDEIAARFDFFSQHYVLRVQANMPQTRIQLKPEYVLGLNKSKLTLNGILSYRVHGPKIEQLVIDMKDWPRNEIGPPYNIGPPNVVDVGRVFESEGKVTVPLLVPADGLIELTIQAEREMPAMDEEGKNRLLLELPVALDAHWLEQPTLFVVDPADNLEVNPLEAPELPEGERIKGLSRTTQRSLLAGRIDISRPNRQSDPLVYRIDSRDARFSADIQLHSQQIEVLSRTDVRLLAQEDQVSQSLEYTVLYEPVRSLSFTVPKEVEANGRLQVTLGRDSQPLLISSDARDTGNSKTVRKTVKLPEESIGSLSIKVRYSYPPIELPPLQTRRYRIPLVVPDEGTLRDNIVNVAVPNGIQTKSADEKWTFFERPGSLLRSPQLQFTAASRENEIPLDVLMEDRGVLGSTQVERAWVQTWLLGERREDRVSYRFTSDRDSLTVQLPGNVDSSRIAIHLDDNPIFVPLEKGKLTIPLGSEQQKIPHTLDIWYEVRQVNTANTRTIELPRLPPEIWVQKMFWEVVTPADKHIIGSCPGWTAEYQWMWNGWFWDRVPTLTQRDIGIWVGTNQVQSLVLPKETNQYLFSSLQPPNECRFYMFDRWIIVLVSSGSILLLGLFLIYFPKLRYPGILFLLGVLLVASIMYRPMIVLVILESGVAGIVLAIIAALLYRIFHQNQAWAAPGGSSVLFPRPELRTENLPSVIVDDDSQDVPPESLITNIRGED